MTKKTAFLAVALALVFSFATVAHAELTVTILSTSPVDGTIGEGDTAKVFWRIESDSSGEYFVEIGGDGTEGSGEATNASDGDGTFSGTTSGSSTISADYDLEDGDGDYTVYVIAVESDGTTDYATTTITLDSPPDQVTGLLVRRGDEKLFLEWDDNEDPDIDYYLIYYSTQSGTDYLDYDGTGASQGSSPIEGDEATNFTMTGLTNEVTYYIRVSAVDDGGVEGPLSAEEVGMPTDTVGFAELQEDEGNCFIATAAFGDYDHGMVRKLRALRDRVLLQTAAGRLFVETYYAVSPPLADWLREHPTARTAVRTALVPVSVAAGWEVERPGAVSLPLLIACTLALVLMRRRRHDGEPQ